MKKIGLMLVLAATTSLSTFAQKKGYKFEINFNESIPDNYVYLAHYFGKYGKDGKPTVYSIDSAKVINKNKVIFEKKDSILGGIYLVLYKNRSTFFQLLVDNGYTFKVNVDKDNKATYTGSKENEMFAQYESNAMKVGKQREQLMEDWKVAKTKTDSTKVQTGMNEIFESEKKFKRDFVAKNPKSLTSLYLNAMDSPDVPKGDHYLADGKTVDSNFTYQYYKDHFWDKFDFTDNRLIHSPIYDSKLEEYFTKLVYPIPDSVNYEGDKLLAKTRGAKELFKYTLHWLAGYTSDGKIMGLDESFIHFVENYYMKGDAYWLDKDGLAKYTDRAQKIAPTVLGNKASELLLQDAFSLADRSLLKLDAKYTVLIFWAIDCSHCQEELPKLVTEYNNVLKAKGVKVYAVSTSGDLKDIQKTIAEKKMEMWDNVVDANHKFDYKTSYDVYATPKIYVLDKDKKIIGKGIGYDQIIRVIDNYEAKKNNVK